MLEERAYSEGELPAKSREPPAYDGSYSDQILDPLKHVSLVYTCTCTYEYMYMYMHIHVNNYVHVRAFQAYFVP